MYCIYCGHKNEDGASFCTKCGKPIESFEEEPAPVPDIFQVPTGPQQPPQDPKKKKTGLLVGLIVGAGVFIIVVIVACVIVFGGREHRAYEEQMEIGEAYFQEEDYNSAIEAFREAINIDETRSAAYTRLCDAYIALGDYNQARAVIDYGKTVVSDSKALKEKEQEIKDDLANGNPGTDAGMPERSDGNSGDGNTGEETLESREEIQAEETQEQTQEQTLPLEDPDMADGNVPEETPDNPWVTTYNDLYFANGNFIVVDLDSIDIYDETLAPVFHYDSEESWYFSMAVTDGTTLYAAANTTSEDGMTGSSVIYRLDIPSGSMEPLYRNDVRNIYLGGCTGERLYYYSSTAQDWMNPGIYYFDLAQPSEHALEIHQSYVEYVGADFFVTTGQRSDVSPVPICVYDLEGNVVIQLAERGMSFEVHGRKIYYSEVTDPESYYPCVIKVYDIDTGETQTLTSDLYLLDFDVCQDGSGLWAQADLDPQTDGFAPDTLVKVDFESGEMEEVYSDPGNVFTFKEVNGYMYIFSGQEMLIYEPEFENAYTVHTLGTDEYFRGFLHVGDAFYLCYINVAGENILILLQ